MDVVILLPYHHRFSVHQRAFVALERKQETNRRIWQVGLVGIFEFVPLFRVSAHEEMATEYLGSTISLISKSDIR